MYTTSSGHLSKVDMPVYGKAFCHRERQAGEGEISGWLDDPEQSSHYSERDGRSIKQP